MPSLDSVPSITDDVKSFDLIAHGHRDLIQAVAFNAYGDRCATGSVDGKIRVFNRQKDGSWRINDNWGAHSGEILELQWIAPTVYPNLIASLGIEGRLKLWAEDDSAAPGRRWSSRAGHGQAASETRAGRHPYRSFSIKHNDETRITYFALLQADGTLSVNESEEPETLADFTKITDFQALSKPERGEEMSLKVRFDPNPVPCYKALRAGVATDALTLAVSGSNVVKVFQSKDTVSYSFGRPASTREFHEVAKIEGHVGLVRDIAWAPGNFRGYDVLATACQDGFVKVFRIDTNVSNDGGKPWGRANIIGNVRGPAEAIHAKAVSGTALSAISTGIDKSGHNGNSNPAVQPKVFDQSKHSISHTVTELSKLDNHQTPVWRITFDDDGQLLGCVNDDGKMICFRQTAKNGWARSFELGMLKTKMVVPS